MARLYPPNIAGTLPSFYGNTVTIPYSMNKTVSVDQVRGFALRIKSASTETLLINQECVPLVANGSSASFSLSQDEISRLSRGEFYKAQLAYISYDPTNAVGYFSTVGIIKYTDEPYASIANWNDNMPNIAQGSIIGLYQNRSDTTERAYAYKFTLYGTDKTTILDTTDWQLHDSTQDDGIVQKDTYSVVNNLENNVSYYLRYEVQTQNNLFAQSPLYEVTANAISKLDLQNGILYGALDYDNAAIELYLIPVSNFLIKEVEIYTTPDSNKQNFLDEPELIYKKITERTEEQITPKETITTSDLEYKNAGNIGKKDIYVVPVTTQLNDSNETVDVYLTNNNNQNWTGTFEIGRTSSVDNYTKWTILYRFSEPVGISANKPIFTDFTIQHGVDYKYAIRQVNSSDIASNWLNMTYWHYKERDQINTNIPSWYRSNIIRGQYEDMFLFDGKRQLKIRFNPEVKTFKTVIQDSKKVAIGSKFPYFFRNGIVAYKEFPIGGLLSYLSDNDEYFFNKDDLLVQEDTTSITDDNIGSERKFKLEVLDWLNDGKVKLFKSPTEGNYIVRLTNVSFSPENKLGRLIHNFTCTADEIADYNGDTLVNYDLISVPSLQNVVTSSIYFMSAHLNHYMIGVKTDDKNQVLNADEATNIFNGYAAYYVKLEGFQPGSTFYLDNLTSSNKFVIGATGQYEVYTESPLNGLYLTNDTLRLNYLNDEYDRALITYGIKSTGFTSADMITKITARTLPYIRFDGAEIADKITAINTNNKLSVAEKERQIAYTKNILNDYQDLKHEITRIYYAKFSVKSLVDIGTSLPTLINYVNTVNTRAVKERYQNYLSNRDRWIDYNTRIQDSDGLYSWSTNDLDAARGEKSRFLTQIKEDDTIAIDDQCIYRVNTKENLTLLKKLFKNDTFDEDYTYINIIYQGQRYKFVHISNYNTDITIGKEQFKLSADKGLMLKNITIVPAETKDPENYRILMSSDILAFVMKDDEELPSITIGNSVIAELGIAQTILTYDVESNLYAISVDNQYLFKNLQSKYEAVVRQYEGTSDNKYQDNAYLTYFSGDYLLTDDDGNYTGKIDSAKEAQALAKYEHIKERYFIIRQLYMQLLEIEINNRQNPELNTNESYESVIRQYQDILEEDDT